MPRTIPTALATALGAKAISPFLAFEAMLDSGPFRVWTGYGDRQINGNPYVGVGTLIEVNQTEETIDLTANSVTVVLNGVPSEVLSAALAEPYQGREGTIYLGDTSTPDVMVVFSGLLDTMTPSDDTETSRISVALESRLVELQRARLSRYTKESQRALHPTDSFFDYTAELADKVTPFGRDDP